MAEAILGPLFYDVYFLLLILILLGITYRFIVT